jgi:pimeloyl-ACP methyl ester carboxylesterase
MRILFTALAMAFAVPAMADTIGLTTADGVQIGATTYGSGDNGVVLIHGKGGTAADWSHFGERLATRGFHVVAVDLRGHGTSAGAAELTAETYPLMVADVHAAAVWLRENGAAKVHLVGDEFGANLAVQAAAADTEINDIALLSAGMNLEGVATPAAMETYGARPALVVASAGDSYSARSASVLEGKAAGPVYLEILVGEAKGVRMLTRDPQLEGKLVAWLNGTYDLDGRRGDRTVTTEAGEDVETTGVRFGDR